MMHHGETFSVSKISRRLKSLKSDSFVGACVISQVGDHPLRRAEPAPSRGGLRACEASLILLNPAPTKK